MADPPPTSSAEALVPSTTALLAAVASTNDSLRQILLGTPSSSREAVGSLSRELNQIQTAGRLLVRHASAPDGDIGLPDVVIAALEVILTQTTQLVGIANQVLETDSSDASPLGNIRTLLETARIAINAGVDALSLYVCNLLLQNTNLTLFETAHPLSKPAPNPTSPPTRARSSSKTPSTCACVSWASPTAQPAPSTSSSPQS